MPRPPKIGRLALASLALNAGLIAALLFLHHRPVPGGPPRPVPPTATATAETSALSPPRATASAEATDWKRSLLEADIPRHAFIAAIRADFDARWNQRDRELQKRYSDGEIEIEDLALFNLDREIALEAAMREALGEAAFREWDRERKFADVNTAALALTATEADGLHALRTSLTDRLRNLERAKLKKELAPDGYAEGYELAQADYEQALRNLVGFQRFNEARDSGIPAYLRRELRGLDISQAQLVQIQDIEGAFGDAKADLQYEAGSGSIDSIKLSREQETLAHWRTEQLQQILGEKAYDVYRRQQDPRYQTMIDFAKDWGLTPQNAETVFQLLVGHETEARRLKLAAYAAGTPPEQTQARLGELQARLDETMRQTLAPEQAEQLRRNGILGP